MITAVLLGAGFGAGVLLVGTGVVPTRPPLEIALRRIHEPRQLRSTATEPDPSFLTRLVGTPLERSLIGTRLSRRAAADLRVTGTTPAALLAKMALGSVVGLVWAPAVFGLMALGGVAVNWLLPAWASIGLASAGALLPLLALKGEAAKKRQAFRHALSCYLDLVAVRLAGGAGVDGALSQSAGSGQGWAFAELRHALAEARLMGEPPWTGLARLGEELAVSELGELAASASLAGGEGARVRASLNAKARSIRTRGLADAEASAQSASERMSLPIVLLMVGFVAFLGYPAVVQVLTGL
jgi:Flp pilus assembly protein TadB